VVLIIDHDEEGSLGLVTNRPTGAPLPSALDRWSDLDAVESQLFRGGPVEANAMLAVGTLGTNVTPAGARPIDDQVSLLDLSGDATILVPHFASVRIFAGYAGWGAGQLSDELCGDGWWVLDREPDDLVAGPELWANVVGRTPGLQRFATLPADPTMN